MLKNNKMFVGLAAAIALILIAGTAVAQESNISKSTFGEIGSEVDNYLDSKSWKDVDFNAVYGFSRFGANITTGVLDLGASFKAGSLYLGFYFNGDVTGNGYPVSTTRKVPLINGADTKDTISVSTINKNFKVGIDGATYGVLAGINDLGILFAYEDRLTVVGGGTGVAATPWAETYTGSVTPYLELGGAFGPIEKIGLGLDIVYNRYHSVAVAGATATYSDATLDVAGVPIAAAANLLAATGNYVAPDIFLKMKFGGFTLKNNLSVPIYGTPSHKTDGKGDLTGGVGFVDTIYDANNGNGSQRVAAWDSRFHIRDIINPSYNISGDAGKVAYSVTAGMPIMLNFITHSLNVKQEGTTAFPNAQEVKGFYKSSQFVFALSPSVAAGVQFKPADVFSLQTGVKLDVLGWTVDSNTTKKVENTDAAQLGAIGSVGGGLSNDSSSTDHYFTMPNLSWAAGFTVNFKKVASLDFAFVLDGQPGVAASIYESVGKGLGSNETSVVLSVKF